MIPHEKIFADKVMNRLSAYFKIESEVWSKCGKNRIDYVITDISTGFPFGIEFKQLGGKRGEEIGEHILQATRYVQSEFRVNDVWQRIPIMICPPISFITLQAPELLSLKIDENALNGNSEFYRDRHNRNLEHHTVNGMLGAFHVGEIRSYKREHFKTKEEVQYLRFVFSNKTLWDEAPEYLQTTPKGIHLTNYAFQITKKANYFFK